MAPFNLENNIREGLENRELKPSPEAWKKLEAQLDRKQPKKKMVLWYYAAASLVGILILGSIFLSQHNLDENSRWVEENVKGNYVKKQSEIIKTPLHKEKIVLENNEEKPKPIKKNTKDPLKSILIEKESTVDRQIRKSEALAGGSEEQINQSSIREAVSEEEMRQIEQKVNEVAGNIKALQNNNSEVTADEVEALLNRARRDIQSKRMVQTPKVDAMALLEEVEWELDKSFRNKVFDALGDGFNRIRTAVIERNN